MAVNNEKRLLQHAMTAVFTVPESVPQSICNGSATWIASGHYPQLFSTFVIRLQNCNQQTIIHEFPPIKWIHQCQVMELESEFQLSNYSNFHQSNKSQVLNFRIHQWQVMELGKSRPLHQTMLNFKFNFWINKNKWMKPNRNWQSMMQYCHQFYFRNELALLIHILLMRPSDKGIEIYINTYKCVCVWR